MIVRHDAECPKRLEAHIECTSTRGYAVVNLCRCRAVRLRVSRFFKRFATAEKARKALTAAPDGA